MTNIVKTQSSGVTLYVDPDDLKLYKDNLPSVTKKFIAASRSPKLKELSMKTIRIEVDDMIELMFVEIGDKHTRAEDKEFIIKQLVHELVQDDNFYKRLSLADIKMALSMGVRGEFDKKLFHTSNDSNISMLLLRDWIKSYIRYEDRIDTLRLQSTFEQSHNKDAEDKQRAEKMKKDLAEWCNSVCAFYDKSKAAGSIQFPTKLYYQALYNYLEKHQLLMIDKAEKEEMWTKARNECAEKYRMKAMTAERTKTDQEKAVLIGKLPQKYSEITPEMKKELGGIIYSAVITDIQYIARERSIEKFLLKAIKQQFDLSAEIRRIEKL